MYGFTSFVLTAGAEVELIATSNNAGTANDNLTGNEFGQAVVGNAGGNVLDGKGGLDALVGLGGADAFTFTTALGAGNVDQMIDMTPGLDKIYLDNAIFATLADGALAAGAFRTEPRRPMPTTGSSTIRRPAPCSTMPTATAPEPRSSSRPCRPAWRLAGDS